MAVTPAVSVHCFWLVALSLSDCFLLLQNTFRFDSAVLGIGLDSLLYSRWPSSMADAGLYCFSSVLQERGASLTLHNIFRTYH